MGTFSRVVTTAVATFGLSMSCTTNTALAQYSGAQNAATPVAYPGEYQTQNQGPSLQQRLQQVDEMVNARMAEQNIPGYCLTIIKDGQVVFQKPYGYADVEQRIPVTPDTIFGLASMTKTFTALTLLSLVDRGAVNLNDPLEKYIGGLVPAYRGLTIRQLASMTAGVPPTVPKEIVWRDQLNILESVPLVSQPGSEFHYSNFSYRLLGTVIEKASGQHYFDMVGETVLAPLAMTSTATTAMMERTGRVARAYGDDNGTGPLHRVQYKDPDVSFAAGMLATTSNDMVKYVFGLLNHRIISQPGYETLWYYRPPLTTGKPSNWAFGWGSAFNQNFNTKVIAMNGGTAGVASTVILMPATNSAVIALCNLRKPPVYQIARTAAKIVFGKDAPDEPNPEQEVYGNEPND